MEGYREEDLRGGVEFGVSLPPTAAEEGRIRELARLADGAGLDLIGVQDHPYAPQFLDTMSLIAVMLADTGRVRVFPNVASLPLRPPAILAKAAASLDVVSGGRFELGLGSGAYWGGIYAMGGPRLAPREATRAFEEGVAVIRAAWNREGGAARFEGEHYALRGVRTGPAPEHDIGIRFGSMGPRMLRLTGRLADGWAAPLPSYVPYEDWDRVQGLIAEGARAAGRDPNEVVRVANVPGTIFEGEGRRGGFPRGSDPLLGSSEHWAEVLAGWALERRFDAFVFWPDPLSAEQIERFAHEVAPAVRERVADERSSKAAALAR